MSRIYDALKKAEQESKQKLAAEPLPPAQPQAQHAKPAPPMSARAIPATPAAPGVPAVAAAVTQPAPALPVSTAANVNINATAAPAPTKPETKKTPIRIFSPAGELRGAEELRRLRTKLQHAREKTPFRTLLVTSAVPGEGKTFISISLAHTLTMQHGARVLIIDADFRKPQLHTELGMPNELGLTDYLEGRCEAEAIIRTTPVPNMHVITGGNTSSHVAELAGSPRFAALTSSLSEEFEWVIVDTSPVIPVTDAALLARVCDATLLVVAASETSGDIAQAALKELKEANIIGVVLNRASRTSSKYRNYYYYEHSSQSGASEPQAAAAVTR